MALFIKPNSEDCCCAHMTGPNEFYPPGLPPPPPEKYYHEVGAEMVGNQLVILMEKDKTRKRMAKRKGWEPPCDCDVVEIKRPTSKRGPRIVNGGDNNQVVFRIHSKAHMAKKEDTSYKPQAVAYKINRAGTEDDHCRKITVYPHLGGLVSQEVYSDHIREDEHDVYLLRVKKRNDDNDGNTKKRNLEVELRTPKPPGPLPPLPEPEPDTDDERKTEKKKKLDKQYCPPIKKKKDKKKR